MAAGESIDSWRRNARAWLSAHAAPREAVNELDWGTGSDSVTVFHNLTEANERELLAAACTWQQTKFDAGYGAIAQPGDFGGQGLPVEYDRAFDEEEAAFSTPETTELVRVTTNLIGPTLAAVGSAWQHAELVRPLLRADLLACQLFSEPNAGSDLAGVTCRAERDGDQWILNGQKVWTSGARFADYGELLARTDPSLPKHRGITAFLVPLDLPGVEVRPIRQITGGSSFNEVFLTDVRVPDRLRIGAEGNGWRVALTTLAFERDSSGSTHRPGGSVPALIAAARHYGRTADPLVRSDIAALFIRQRVRNLVGARVDAARRAGQPPGPEASIGKLLWTQDMAHMTSAIGRILGPRLIADTGEWGTYAWTEHVLGAPGYRIAGGSDEIQRTIIAERVLGLPADSRVDKEQPFSQRLSIVPESAS